MLGRFFGKKKRFLIVTGPQGSGNHLFAKLFSTDPRVFGWKMKAGGWESHRLEPFQRFWADPSALRKDIFPAYAFTSISVPYRDPVHEHAGTGRIFSIPPVREFYERTRSLGIDVTICVIGRDPTILNFQQMRRRGAPSTEQFFDMLDTLSDLDLYYLSHENLLLYKRRYLRQISKDLHFPIDLDHPDLETILIDQNEKYIHPVMSRDDDPALFDSLYPRAYDRNLRRKR